MSSAPAGHFDLLSFPMVAAKYYPFSYPATSLRRQGRSTTLSFSVQALTDVCYCGYWGALLKERLASDTPLRTAWTELIVTERKQNFDLLIDLGCLSAEERIAHFLVQLMARLEQRPSLVKDPLIIPLPQWLIAAALGLTPEYVSRVISTFRQKSMVEKVEEVSSR